MSFDPVAHDRLGLQIAEEALSSLGLDLGSVRALASPWLKAGGEKGLGVDRMEDINVEEIHL